ncbi:Type I phosphodiesterase / nucleotide pyrophosphatase [Caloramator mitchellensis]|uniref:Type I phosphodiesterase / nucleotide pyrophosphatase n=1 Tax=Caloramator mitchellensis TaxID=908809 RepID=A0A0R3JV08_CALMK|nr:ectonucleotide pyrophosphatase/phosphodiesterase [Caloramator mitchellensis]KRQ86906.1 Type I phosphodiesterase / nucleotide pyrophosphatase [Caloramator mitchellensis]
MGGTRFKNLIIISFDAVCKDDYDYLITLPNFSEFLKGSNNTFDVESVYPTLTYPVHVSMMTGKLPNEHGVVNNTLIQPNRRRPDWYWYRKYVKSDTIYDAARRKGLVTAALLWPVTAKADIKYHMPEIFANRPWQNQITISLSSGSLFYQIDLVRRFGHLFNSFNQPDLDNFVLECSLYTIKKYKPNLMLIHFTDADTQKHKFGAKSKEALEALKRHDIRLSKIRQAIEDAGISKDTVLCILGDHGSLDVDKEIRLNKLFSERGLIKQDNRGRIIDYDAYLKSCDGSAYVYLKEENQRLKDSVLKVIDEFSRYNSGAIERVFTKEDSKTLGFDSGAFLMLEAGDKYSFSSKNFGDLITQSNYKAVHGQLPYKHKTFFALSNNEFDMKNIKKITDFSKVFESILGIKLQG